MKETDLYKPVKQLLEKQNYIVKGEINNCDIIALKENEGPVVIELKVNLNIEVILQAVDRLSMSTKVYIGIPAGTALLKRRNKQVIKLLKMLGLGLIIVNSKGSRADVVIDPVEYKPRISKHKKDRLLGEFASRIGDPNLGGSDKKRGIMTAYRQKALGIARYLHEHDATKASVITKVLEEPKARDILYRNVYGWFDKKEYGVYLLSPRGKNEIAQWQ